MLVVFIATTAVLPRSELLWNAPQLCSKANASSQFVANNFCPPVDVPYLKVQASKLGKHGSGLPSEWAMLDAPAILAVLKRGGVALSGWLVNLGASPTSFGEDAHRTLSACHVADLCWHGL